MVEKGREEKKRVKEESKIKKEERKRKKKTWKEKKVERKIKEKKRNKEIVTSKMFEKCISFVKMPISVYMHVSTEKK